MLLKYTPKITDLLMFFSLMNPHKSSLAIITSNKENDWGAEHQESYLPLLPLFVHVMGECCRGEMKYHVINSRIPPPLSSHPALIFVCRSKRTSVRLLVQRMSEHPPFLKIGCAERGLKIDPPPINSVSEIFMSHSHLLSTTAYHYGFTTINTSSCSSWRFPQPVWHIMN